MRKIAITGGLATGKSTVLELFKDLGAYTLSADEIVHSLLTPHTELGHKIEALLGSEVREGETFNRQKIAQKVFRDPTLLTQLEAWLHPEVQRIIEATYKEVSPSYSLFVVEIPLLYESHMDPWYDTILLVNAPEPLCIKRFGDAAEYARRTRRLLPFEERAKRADYLVENQGSLDALKTQIKHIHNQLRAP